MTSMLKCPLKVILFGEHSVIDGGRCIVVAISTYAELKETLNNGIVRVMDVNNNSVSISVEGTSLVLNTDTGTCNPNIVVNTYFGSGLGTSASICLLLALIKNKANGANNSDLLSQAEEFEHFFHGRSSGVDVNACYYGGCISFINKEVERLNYTFLEEYKLVIYDSKIPKMTKSAIANTSNNCKRKQLKDIADRAYYLIQSKFELISMYALIREAQDVLEEMGLVPEKMKREVRRLRKIGIESKLSGGGQGGHLFTFVEKDRVIEGWQEVEIDKKGLCGRIEEGDKK